MITMEQARSVRDILRQRLNRPEWLRGIGIGAEQNGSSIVHVLVSKLTDTVRNTIPDRIDGVPIEVVETGDFFPSNDWAHGMDGVKYAAPEDLHKDGPHGHCPKCGKKIPLRHPDWPAIYEAQGPGFPPGDPASLKERLTVDELNARRHQNGQNSWFNQRIDGFLAAMKPGDEIRRYDTMTGAPPLSGAMGYYLIRDGMVVADLVTLVS